MNNNISQLANICFYMSAVLLRLLNCTLKWNFLNLRTCFRTLVCLLYRINLELLSMSFVNLEHGGLNIGFEYFFGVKHTFMLLNQLCGRNHCSGNTTPCINTGTNLSNVYI